MISYSQLGKNGQLGNQMFQYAALYGAGFIRGYDIHIPPDGHRLREIFKLGSAKDIFPDAIKGIYKEPSFPFNANIWCLPKGIDLHGYFQSDLYFSHCADRIREEFQFNDEVIDRANDYVTKNNLHFDGIVCVSLHVRRGDYLNLSNYHTNLSLQYYRKIAFGLTHSAPDSNLRLFVFSDDVEWCKENLGIDRLGLIDTVYIETGYDAADLQIMSRCHAHIIANSSFSWWGAWLSNCDPQNVFAPAEWFGPEGPRDWSTIYPRGWRTI